MSVVYICIIGETKAKQSCSGFANTYFHRWSKEISDQRQNACRAWGWLILGRYRRLVGRRSRRQSPSIERGTGHRPLVQHHQSLGKELFAKHLVKITISGSRCLSCRGSCEASWTTSGGLSSWWCSSSLLMSLDLLSLSFSTENYVTVKSWT